VICVRKASAERPRAALCAPESAILTHGDRTQTNIDIDDDLMRDAMRASGAPPKRAAIEQGLRLLVNVRGQRAIRRLRGKVTWTGDLEASRLGRAASGR
jgi:Arc/MetJ family transcription regulator